MEGTVAVTFNIDIDAKNDFKLETIQNGQSMSMVVQDFMKEYCKASVHLREERIINKWKAEQEAKQKYNGEEQATEEE